MRLVSVSSGGSCFRIALHGFNRGLAAEGPFAREHLVKNRAETEKIGAVVGVLSLHLLRRHVADRTHHHAGLGLRGQGRGVGRNCALRAGELGQTEVQNLHPTVARDKNILRLQIAVDDSLLMRRRQTTRNLLGVFGGFAHRQRPGTQPLAQCLTLQKLGDHVGRAFVLAKIVHRQNVRMIQRSRGLRLLLKAPQPLGIAGETHRQDLDRDLAVEASVAGAIDLAHAAGA